MKSIFIGGSRDVSRLPAEIKERLDVVMAQGHRVVLGDANGADKAVQKYLADQTYPDVILFCSGDRPRNNVGDWPVRNIIVDSKTKDYQFYAAKDRKMAAEADFGLMIWDGKSPGTLLNLVRLLQAGKIAVLYHLPRKEVFNFKTDEQLRVFIAGCGASIRSDIEKRTTASERGFLTGQAVQPSLLDAGQDAVAFTDPVPKDEAAIAELNAALVSGNMERIVEVLGSLARHKGMSHIARDTGLARESLYRSLDAGGNPEFATVMKVLSSLGVELAVKPSRDKESPRGR